MRFLFLGLVLLLSSLSAQAHIDRWRGEEDVEVGMLEVNHVYAIKSEERGMRTVWVITYQYSQVIFWEEITEYVPGPIKVWYPSGFRILKFKDKDLTQEVISKDATYPMRDFVRDRWFLFLYESKYAGFDDNPRSLCVTSKLFKETHTLGDPEREARKKYGKKWNLDSPWAIYRKRKHANQQGRPSNLFESAQNWLNSHLQPDD